MMTNYSENDLTIPSLKIIENYKNGIDTQNLINQLRIALKPNGEDILILVNRSDDRFSQKVRNLRSHKSLEKKNWVKFKDNKYYITDDGLTYLREKKDYLNLEKKEIIFNLIPLKYFNFSERINTFLKLTNCKFVCDLNSIANYGEDIDELKTYPNMGQKSIEDLKNFYKKYSLFLDIKKIKFDDPLSLYNKNEDKINKFVIGNIENEGVENKADILNIESLTIFLKKNFKINFKTAEIIFNERILNNVTLQSVANKLNVTRERIRQIEKTIVNKLKANLTFERNLYKVDLIIKKIVIENAESFHKRIKNKELVDKSLSIYNIISLLKIFGFQSVKKFKKINRKYFIFESNYYEKELKKIIKNFISKNSRENGIINLDILHRNLLSQNFNISSNTLFNLIDEKIVNNSVLLSDNLLLTNVLRKTKKSNNILVGVIQSTLSVTNKIDLDELILCIKQFRRINNYSPEPKILIKICEFLNYEIEDNFIINKDYSNDNYFLKGVRKNLFKMFLDNERIMTYEEILENYEKYNLNLNSVNVMLYENLFIIPRKGIYVLAGTNTEEYILDRLDRKRQQELKKLSDDTSWKYNKSLNIVFSCNKIILQKGKIYMPNNFATELPEGHYTIKTFTGTSSVKVYASQIWFDGPSKIFLKKYMKNNVHLEFDTINKTIIVNSND